MSADLERPRSRAWLRHIATACLLGASASLCLGLPWLARLANDPLYYGLSLERPAPEFEAQAADGSKVALSDLKGSFVYLVFGFLSCQQLCHSRALTFQQLASRVPRNDVRFLFIALDPARDSQSQLAAYFDHRGSNFLSLRPATNRQAGQIADAFGEAIHRQTDLDAASNAITHGASIFLIDPQGRLRLRYGGLSLDVGAMARDWQQLATNVATKMRAKHEST